MLAERQVAVGSPVMKEKFNAGAQKLSEAAKARPAETKWSLIGAAAGGGSGLLIGGVGIVAMGSGVGIPAGIILALVGGAIGNRYGISKDRPIR